MAKPRLLPPCAIKMPPMENMDYRCNWFRNQKVAVRSVAFRFYKAKEGYARVSRAYWHDLRPEGISINTGDPDADKIILRAVRCGDHPSDVVRSLRALICDPNRKGRDNTRAKELLALFAAAGAKTDARVRRHMHPSFYTVRTDPAE